MNYGHEITKYKCERSANCASENIGSLDVGGSTRAVCALSLASKICKFTHFLVPLNFEDFESFMLCCRIPQVELITHHLL